MKTIWFRRVGIFYIPIHLAGYLITLIAIASLAPAYKAISDNSHSISGGLLQLFLYATCTAFWWKWIADRTSN